MSMLKTGLLNWSIPYPHYVFKVLEYHKNFLTKICKKFKIAAMTFGGEIKTGKKSAGRWAGFPDSRTTYKSRLNT